VAHKAAQESNVTIDETDEIRLSLGLHPSLIAKSD